MLWSFIMIRESIKSSKQNAEIEHLISSFNLWNIWTAQGRTTGARLLVKWNGLRKRGEGAKAHPEGPRRTSPGSGPGENCNTIRKQKTPRISQKPILVLAPVLLRVFIPAPQILHLANETTQHSWASVQRHQVSCTHYHYPWNMQMSPF